MITEKLDRIQAALDDLPDRIDTIAELACYRALERHVAECPVRHDDRKIPSWVRVVLGAAALVGAAVGGALGLG